MIKILSAPRKFDGHAAVIQENAIRSWMKLFGAENVCLFGDDETKNFALRFGVQYEKPQYSDTGIPLLDSILNQARKRFKKEYFLYINADIILLSDFKKTISVLMSKLTNGFLLVGRRTNIDIESLVNFECTGAEDFLRDLCNNGGKLASAASIDYFLFPRNSFKNIPPLRIGRAGFDNILIYWAKRFEKIPVVDGTEAILAIHQNHDYGHVVGGFKGSHLGVDAQENVKTINGQREKLFRLTESDYKMIGNDILKNHGASYYLSKRYLLEVLPSLYPIFWPLVTLRKKIARLSSKFKKIHKK